MLDSKTIQSNYAKMTEHELLALWSERHSLREDVVSLLKTELDHRTLLYEEDKIPAASQEFQDERKAVSEAHEYIADQRQQETNILEEIKSLQSLNETKEDIYKKLGADFNADKETIDRIYTSMKKRGSIFILIGILLSFPAILRSIITGNGSDYDNLGIDLLYIALFGTASIVFLYRGIKLRSNFR